MAGFAFAIHSGDRFKRFRLYVAVGAAGEEEVKMGPAGCSPAVLFNLSVLPRSAGGWLYLERLLHLKAMLTTL